MKRLERGLRRVPVWGVVVLALLLVAIIGAIDYITGDYSILIFYMLPVCLASWYAGRWRGVLVAVTSGSARYVADFPLYVNRRLLYWNSLEDTLFLAVVALLVVALRRALEKNG